MFLYHDTETIPGQDPAIKAAILKDIDEEKAAIQAPSNYKDPVKIQEYIANKRAELDANADEAWRKTALDGTRGELFCISWALNDASIRHVYRELVNGALDSEADMLRRFWAELAIDVRGRPAPCWVGHNTFGFDIRFIFQRSVILNVRPSIMLPIDSRGNGPFLYDTMLAWAGWGNRVKMDTVCEALGIACKGAELDGEHIDGSMVWDYVLKGEGRKVVTYCDGDVDRTRQMHRRMTFADFVQTEAA